MTRTVTGLFITPGGLPATGHVVFTPTDRLVDQAANKVILPLPVVAHLDLDGRITIDLLPTDQPELQTHTAGPWSWHVRECITGQPDTTYTLQVPAAGAPLDLATTPGSLAAGKQP